MTQFSQSSAFGSRSFPRSPEGPFEEQSQVQLRALGSARGWEQEDPFPLVRHPSDRALSDSEELDIDIDVTFDHTRVSSEPPPAVAETRPLYESIPVYDTPPQSAVVPTYEEDVPPPREVRSRRARAIASRVAFAVVFLGIAALLVYEIRILMQTGLRPF